MSNLDPLLEKAKSRLSSLLTKPRITVAVALVVVFILGYCAGRP